MENEEDTRRPDDDGWVKPEGTPVNKNAIVSNNNIAPRAEPRGIGPEPAYEKQPIGCVVEVLKRGWDEGSKKFVLYPPFDRGTPKDAKWTFAIMTARTTGTRMIGNKDSACRMPHPDFKIYNEAAPEKAQTLGVKLVHFDPKEAWNFHLGAFKAPVGRTGPKTGWWCAGDGETALRKENGKETKIKCPNRMCEFSQEGSGPRGAGSWCHTHTRLIAQLNWAVGSPLPRIMFEWNSMSYHAYQNVEACFRLIEKTASGFNLPNFPVIGLPIRLSVDKSIRPGKQFPEVTASIDGDMGEYIAKIRAAMIGGEITPGNQLNAPQSLRALPPPGMNRDDVDHATLTRLDPNYKPSNERS